MTRLEDVQLTVPAVLDALKRVLTGGDKTNGEGVPAQTRQQASSRGGADWPGGCCDCAGRSARPCPVAVLCSALRRRFDHLCLLRGTALAARRGAAQSNAPFSCYAEPAGHLGTLLACAAALALATP